MTLALLASEMGLTTLLALLLSILTLKRLGGQYDPPCDFWKNVSSKERVKTLVFCDF